MEDNQETQDNILTLIKNEAGEVSQVVTTTVKSEVAYNSAEIKRQIDEHQTIIDKLIPQYDAVKAFEDSDETETEVDLSESSN